MRKLLIASLMFATPALADPCIPNVPCVVQQRTLGCYDNMSFAGVAGAAQAGPDAALLRMAFEIKKHKCRFIGAGSYAVIIAEPDPQTVIVSTLDDPNAMFAVKNMAFGFGVPDVPQTDVKPKTTP